MINTMTQQMRSIELEKFVLRLVEVAVLEPAPGQVRVRIAPAGVDPVDAKIRSGAMPRLPITPGSDLAGAVDTVGAGTGFAAGDEGLGWSDTGAYAG